MELIFNNSKQFNGEQSEYTAKAKKLLDITKEKLYQEIADDYLAKLEEKIQERELDEHGDLESLGTFLSLYISVKILVKNLKKSPHFIT